jgi:ABC-type branched-subunit amino acid transport system permease subunit
MLPKKNGVIAVFDSVISGWKYYFLALSILSMAVLLGSPDFFLSYGLFLIVSLSIHWLWGWAEIPFLGTSVPLMAGGFVISSITARLAYFLARSSGMAIQPWGGAGWLENSEINASLAGEWLASNPAVSIGLVVLSLLVAFAVGGITGWITVRPGLGKSDAMVAIISYSLLSAGSWLALRITQIGGGYNGVYIPDLFLFAGEYRLTALIMLVLFIIFIGLFGYDQLRGSSFGLDVKNKTDERVQSQAVFLGCGLIGVAGCLLSIYYGFVIQANFYGANWKLYPLLILLVAGSSGGFGLVLGVLLLMGFQYMFRLCLPYFSNLFFPVAYLHNIELGLLIIFACFYLVKRNQFQNIESEVLEQ